MSQYKQKESRSNNNFSNASDHRYSREGTRSSGGHHEYTSKGHDSNNISSSYPERNNHQEQRQTIATVSAMNDDEYNIQVMRDREAEILEINKKMHTVNEIYHDLAGMIDGQQELIDQIDNQIELSNVNTQAGYDNYNTAKLRAENPILDDPFGERLGRQKHKTRDDKYGDQSSPRSRRSKSSSKKKRRSKSKHRRRANSDFDCTSPLETMRESIPPDVQEVITAGLNDMKIFGTRMITACTAPSEDSFDGNEYAYRSERF